MGPGSTHGGSTGHPPTHSCSQSLAGWHGHCPLAGAWRGARQPPTAGLPSRSCFSICLGAVVTSAISLPFLSYFLLLNPAGLIPGAGWVWEEDEDSWDSLAGGLLAWSRAELLSHPHHSLPRP